MYFRKLLGVAFGAAMLGGCAIHPVQQQVTGVPTAEVVRRIRCETRVAIIEKARQLLLTDGNIEAAEFLASESAFDEKKLVKLLDREEFEFYEKYKRVFIAYDFTFDIEEQNIVGVNLDPISIVSRGTVTTSLGATGTVERNNLRNFLFSEAFIEILNDKKLLECKNKKFFENFSYPIVGRIGMFEVISTFVDLNVTTELKKPASGVNVFADTLRFTTTVEGSASPKVVLAAAGNVIGYDNAFFKVSGKRTDNHKVILGLSFPDPPVIILKGKEKNRVSGIRSRAAVPGLVPQVVVPSGGSGAEQRALDAVTVQRYNTFLDRLGRSVR